MRIKVMLIMDILVGTEEMESLEVMGMWVYFGGSPL